MSGRPRPRVLLADDHASMLSAASAILAPDYEIVAAMTDARQALETALTLAPDVVVLDVTMPELDGFQVARELERLGSSAEIVFLSMHRSDDYVEAGFDAGGHGYVVKTRMRSDLTSAVAHALAGRIFVPSLSALSALATEGGHAIQLHTDHESAASEGAGLVATALARGDAVIVYASDTTRAAVSRCLRANGVRTAGAGDRYCETDPSQFIEKVMRNGRPSVESVGEIVDACDAARIASAGPGSRLTIFGEVSALLFQHGRYDDALSIERMWNECMGSRPILTVCSYALDTVPGNHHARLCAEHWAVTHTGHA